jgi:hypothetical protein
LLSPDGNAPGDCIRFPKIPRSDLGDSACHA